MNCNILLVPILLLSACATDAPRGGEDVGDAKSRTTAVANTLPMGATLNQEGYATILDAPPVHFEPLEPREPDPPSAEQIEGQRQFARVAEFQNSVREEVEALDERLRAAVPDNYVTLSYENEGTPSVAFQFLRNGAATLAKYTNNPRFKAMTVRFSKQQLIAAADYMWKTFEPDRVLQSTGVGRDVVNVEVAVPEREFRALVARKGVTLPDPVQLRFFVKQKAEVANEPLPPKLARLIRIFPRSDRPLGMLHSINSTAKVVLRDGCFRAADREDALVLFPLGTRLFVDGAGYLAFGAETPGYARVGETLEFQGSVGEVTAPELVEPIHRTCGAGRVVQINGTDSAAAQRQQATLVANTRALQDFRRSYGLSEAGALAALERCKQRSSLPGSCITSPPRPVGSQADCPDNTKLSFGLCRTSEGYIRPLPEWLREFADR